MSLLTGGQCTPCLDARAADGFVNMIEPIGGLVWRHPSRDRRLNERQGKGVQKAAG